MSTAPSTPALHKGLVIVPVSDNDAATLTLNFCVNVQPEVASVTMTVNSPDSSMG